MKRDVTALLKEALTLSAEDRAAIAEALLASLDGSSDDDAEAAWKSEIERRTAELDAGEVSPIPWPQVRRRLFERARRRAKTTPRRPRSTVGTGSITRRFV